MWTSAIQGGLGVNPAPLDVRVIVRGADIAKGDLVAFDLAQTYATNARVGDADGSLSQVLTPFTAAEKYGVLGVALEAIPQNMKGRVRLRGVVEEAYCIKAAGNIVTGDPLTATDATRNLNAALTAGRRIIALALQAATAPSTHTLLRVAFDGIHGLGTVV